jgi:glycerophosphoryl diester phosphodiesterase
MAVGGRAAAVAGLLLIASIAEIGVVAPRAPAAGDDQVARPASAPAETVPVLGDFDGDGRGDLLWYGPGGDPDVLWRGRRGGRFAARTLAVRGDYRPLAGDFNGDGARDVVWYQPGPGADVVWFGHGNGRFSARRVQAPDGAEPFGGDFDGDGRRDVFWYGPGAAADRLWYGGAGGRFTLAPAAVHGSYRPLVADFGGDGPDDVLWWAPGAAGDVLWFGRGSRRFTSRWTTVDLDYQRAAALRPETLATSYNPYGFVAHAMGSVNGLLYSNSLEAFQRNLGRGFRVFECDHVLLADGTALVAHDGLEANYGLDKPFQQATWAELAGHRYRGQLTVLRSQDVLQLLADHPDVYMIPDPKYARPEIYRAYVRQAAAMGRLDLLERVMPHVADQAELDALRAYYPLRNYVLALYHSQAHNRMDDAAVVDFVRRNRVPAVMMWWRDRDPALSLAANGRQGRRYRPELTGALRAAGAVTYVHSLAGPADIQRFWDLGVGVYSDEPFPPLGAATPAVRAPAFGPSTALPPA